MVFFTFSTADLHWPELYDLMQDASRNVFTDQESFNNRHQATPILPLGSSKNVLSYFWRMC